MSSGGSVYLLGATNNATQLTVEGQTYTITNPASFVWRMADPRVDVSVTDRLAAYMDVGNQILVLNAPIGFAGSAELTLSSSNGSSYLYDYRGKTTTITTPVYFRVGLVNGYVFNGAASYNGANGLPGVTVRAWARRSFVTGNNNQVITIPQTGTSSPYPSKITFSNVSATVSHATV